MGVLKDAIFWYQRRRDNKHIDTIIDKAFKDNRFVLLITLKDLVRRECFAPRYDEAEQFLSLYVVPFFTGRGLIFSADSWHQSIQYSQMYRWQDVERIGLYTEYEEQRTMLVQLSVRLINEQLALFARPFVSRNS